VRDEKTKQGSPCGETCSPEWALAAVDRRRFRETGATRLLKFRAFSVRRYFG
jgi:hypothetical protein